MQTLLSHILHITAPCSKQCWVCFIDVTGEDLLWGKLGFATDVKPGSGEVRSAQRMNVYFLPFELVMNRLAWECLNKRNKCCMTSRQMPFKESTFRSYTIGKWNSCFSVSICYTCIVVFAVLALPIFVYYSWPWTNAVTCRSYTVQLTAGDKPCKRGNQISIISFKVQSDHSFTQKFC